ncbi:hypothetical protein MHTCC0001_17310 [Flavobacteriaceae bacterium MHTCC 0001]
MDKLIKKNIRLLVEKYNHSIEYNEDHISIYDSLNKIKVFQNQKYDFKVEYNIILNEVLVDVVKDDIYDILIELLERVELYELKEKTGFLLDINRWIKEEGGSKEIIRKLIEDTKNNSLEYEHLGGNRIEAEYYKGLIILKDDLYWDKSNVINLKTDNDFL